MEKILLLEDDQSFGYILSEYLGMQDFDVVWTKTGKEAIALMSQHIFDLAILDIMLPDMNGFEVAEHTKTKHPNLPFIFLSAKSLKIDKLKGYRTGAVDYITKPVDEELLVVKIRALIGNQKKNSPSPNEYHIGNYVFHPSIQQLSHNNEITKLTTREAALLEMLCQHKNQLLPRKKALHEIWGNIDEFSRKSMDVFISHLRKYLAKDDRVTIENVHGKGFVLKEKNS
ncbi:MAG: response regulator transcription factor [Saprospiraceae bacterium]